MRACPSRIEHRNRTSKSNIEIEHRNRKSKRNETRRSSVPDPKTFPFVFQCFERTNDLQPNAKNNKKKSLRLKIEEQIENTNSNIICSVCYWSAQPRQNIISGPPYTALNPLLLASIITATQPLRSPINSEQANHDTSLDVLGPSFPGVRAKSEHTGCGLRKIEDDALENGVVSSFSV